MLSCCSSGSRNLGIQVCKYYQKLAETDYQKACSKVDKKVIETMLANGRKMEIPAYVSSCKVKYDKGLVPLVGESFENYLHDMDIVQEYAEANRKAMLLTICKEMSWDNFTSFETKHNYIDFSPCKNGEHPILRKGAVAEMRAKNLLFR